MRTDVGTWLITLFTMANTLFVPLAGRLANRIGHVHVFLLGLILFFIGSAMCGISNNFPFLLIYRVIQGAGGGLILPVSLSLILAYFPENKRGVAIGFWSFFVMVGPAMGPMVGGWLANTHWHWMFLMNLPISLFIFIVVITIVGLKKEETEKAHFDYRGFALLVLFIAPLQIAFNRGQIDDWFRSDFIITLFIISATALVFFLLWGFLNRNSFIDFSYFSRRNFSLASLTTGMGMGMLFASFVLESMWVQKTLGYTPAWAGISLAPLGILPLIMYPVMGRLVGLLDARIWVISSFLLYACTFFWLSRINTETTFWFLAAPRFVQGIGFALFTVPNSALAIQNVKKENLTYVISLFSFVRLTIVGFAVALMSALWIHREAFYQTRTASRSFPNNPHFKQLLAQFSQVSTPDQAIGLANDAVMAHAQTLGLADIYYAFAWCFLGLCLIVLCYKPKLEPA